MFVGLKILIWFTCLYSTCTCYIGQTKMHKSLLGCGKVKTLDSRTCVFAFLKMILYRHAGWYCLEWRGGGGNGVHVTFCSLNYAWQFADHDKTDLVSNVIIADSVFLLLYWSKKCLNCFERCSYKGKLLPRLKVLRVKRTCQKFGSFVYFILVAIQSWSIVTWNSNAWTSSRTLDKSSLSKVFKFQAI